MKPRTFFRVDPTALLRTLRPGRRARRPIVWENVGRVAFLVCAIAAYLAIMLLMGCTRQQVNDAKAIGDAAAATIGGPWGAVITGVLAIGVRAWERGRMKRRHEVELATERQRAQSEAVTAIQSMNAGKPYPPSTQIPNGDGLVPHG